MPWNTPTLRQVRENVRDNITAALYGASFIGNNPLRVMGDVMAGTCHLVLRYIDWLSKQLLPDTAEQEWLDRHATIWLVNSDKTVGRKMATYAEGTVNFSGDIAGVIIPAGSIMNSGVIEYQTLDEVVATNEALTPGRVRAVDPGAAGNREPGDLLTFSPPIPNVIDQAAVVVMRGGVDTEQDDDLRVRVLERIRKPPMGGDADDYVLWTLSIPGVTRAWSYPNEMGMGTVTVRFMMDDLRANFQGFPLPEDVEAVRAYLDTVRPVAVKDFFVVAPMPQELSLSIRSLVVDDETVRASIEQSIKDMLYDRASPGQTIYRSWIEMAIAQVPNVDHYNLDFEDTPMQTAGHMPVLGTIVYL